MTSLQYWVGAEEFARSRYLHWPSSGGGHWGATDGEPPMGSGGPNLDLVNQMKGQDPIPIRYVIPDIHKVGMYLMQI